MLYILDLLLGIKSEDQGVSTGTGGVVTVVPEPLLVLLKLVAEVVSLLLVNGMATEGECGPLHTFCLGAHLPKLSSLCCWSF